MDSKYGRLFTERDVEAMLEAAHDHGMGEGAAAAEGHTSDPPLTIESAITAAEDRLGHPLTFPADEPLFLLRGQDKAAPACIARGNPPGVDYAQSCLNERASDHHLSSIWKAATAMRDWQQANPERCKVPD